MWHCAVLVFLVVVTGSCGFPPLPAHDALPLDGPETDATADAGPCVPSSTVCDDVTDRYVECSPTGTVELEMDCPLGCADGVEKCLDIDPSNSLARHLDQAGTDPLVTAVTFTGDSSIDTSTGVVIANGTELDVPNDELAGMQVFMFRSVEILGDLTVTGSRPLVLVVDGDVRIDGLIDVSASNRFGGPGSLDDPTCNGEGTPGTSEVSPTPGAGGGGRSDPGGGGGDAGDGQTGYAGGGILRDDDIVPLRGGCRGGTIRQSTGAADVAFGGGGGGAIQIVSRTTIELSGTGRIDASGGGGQACGVCTSNPAGGGGGGAGGAILLEAPSVVLDGAAVVLSTKGGGGASRTEHGTDGGTTASPADGGDEAAPFGGSGGTETLAPTSGAAGGSSAVDGAGGGGSVGQARFNTSSGAIVQQNNASIRSRYTSGLLATRLVP